MRAALFAGTLALVCSVGSAALGSTPVRPVPAGMAIVGPGVYSPLYPASPAEKSVPVKRFLLDRRPVTNATFLEFVRRRPEWDREHVKRLLADKGYLAHWAERDSLGPEVRPQSPVTGVSWFAAKAFCADRGARLPSEREWELAARASETSIDGTGDPKWVDKILAFYAQPATSHPLGDVGRGKPNYWGIQDLHGLVWEWVYDFGASLVNSDSREKGDADTTRFCGASGADAQNPSDYAAFMRIAFRSSLQASYTTARLGFRCARDFEETP